MIARDCAMRLIVSRASDGRFMRTFELGFATLDGNEYNRLRDIAEQKGLHVEIVEVEDDEHIDHFPRSA